MIQVINKTRKTLQVDLKLDEPDGEIQLIGDPLVVKKGEVGEAQFLVLVKKSDLKSSNTEVEFEVMSEGKKMDETKSTFVGPNSLDRK
jgi:hypothetical protein